MRAKLYKRVESHLMYLDRQLRVAELAVELLAAVDSAEQTTLLIAAKFELEPEHVSDSVWTHYRRLLKRRNRFVDLYWHELPEGNEANNLLKDLTPLSP